MLTLEHTLSLVLDRRDYDRCMHLIHFQWPQPLFDKLGRPIDSPGDLHDVKHLPGDTEALDAVSEAVRLRALLHQRNVSM